MVLGAQIPELQALKECTIALGETTSPLDCGAAVSDGGTLTFQWESSTDGIVWTEIAGATGASYLPPSNHVGSLWYRVKVTNTVDCPYGLTPATDLFPSPELYPATTGTVFTAEAVSNPALVSVVGAEEPTFLAELVDHEYDSGSDAIPLDATATAPFGSVSYQWQSSSDGTNWTDIPGAENAVYIPDTFKEGKSYFRCTATNIVGTSSAYTVSGTAEITVFVASEPVFLSELVDATYLAGDSVSPLDGTARVERGTIVYQWYLNGEPLEGENGATYTPSSKEAFWGQLFVRATNYVGNTSAYAESNVVTVEVHAASAPYFSVHPESIDVIEFDPKFFLQISVSVSFGELDLMWESSGDGSNWVEMEGETATQYAPPTDKTGLFYYRVKAINTVGSSTAFSYSKTAVVKVTAAQIPVFQYALEDASYFYAEAPATLNGIAKVSDGGTITYQWYCGRAGEDAAPVIGETDGSMNPSTVFPGQFIYYVVAENRLRNSVRSAQSNVILITVTDTRLTSEERWRLYLKTLHGNFMKLARLEFLQPDGTVAFALDNSAKHGTAFIQDGTLTVNLQNGMRRKATVTLANMDDQFSYQVNKIWFGQMVRLMEGVLLPNGDEFYLPQGVFYIKDPEEVVSPTARTVSFSLVDKWSYLDGTLFGNLDGIYEVPAGRNIYTAIESILRMDRGNGLIIDREAPVFTDVYNGKTTVLPDGSTVKVLDAPYTCRCESNYGDIILEMNTMLAGWVGYDASGRFRLDPSDDDLLDAQKAVLWDFSTERTEFLGATYQIRNSEVYNDIIIEGENLDSGGIAHGRATNQDPRSDTSVYGALGRRTLRKNASSYYSNKQCEQLACYWLKRYTTLKKSVSINANQIFHLQENNLVTIRRPDKDGCPVERHLVTGFSRPIAQSGPMVINATSVQDFPEATVTTVSK